MVTDRRAAAAPLGLPLEDHIDLDDMDVRQFVFDPEAQHLLCVMQSLMLEEPYQAFGRTEGSEDRFNIVFPSTFGSDRRKPVTTEFQAWAEAVYWPLMSALLFGERGWEAVRRHLTSFKINTLRISEDEFYYGQPIYHFHLDHKIGAPAPRDQNQRMTMRLIFSVVPRALAARPDGAVVALDRPEHDSTVYLRRQPPHGFRHNDELHAYLQRRFPERGVSAGRERPLYEVGDEELYRARPGEVLTHHSHPGRPVHAETNPCPEGRGLYVLDWTDCRNVAPPAEGKGAGKVLPATRMPVGIILERLGVLAEHATDGFRARLEEVLQAASRLGDEAERHRGGRRALEGVRQHVESALRRARLPADAESEEGCRTPSGACSEP